MSGMTQQTSDTLSSMSDEDFLKALPNIQEEPAQQEESSEEAKEAPVQTEVETTSEEKPVEENLEAPSQEQVEEPVKSDGEVQEEVPTETPEEKPKTEEENPLNPDDAEAPKKDDAPKEEAPVAKTPEEYKSFTETVMAPFKANGKMLQVKDAQEAIQLMQMGANYTRKMQELQPARKTIMLLEKHDLLDEDKLSYLIDLHEKNPEAIKKLVKDAGIEPMDIDPDEKTSYVSGNHQLSNEEFAFRAAVQEVATSTNGRETIEAVSGWDQTSQDFIWKNPNVLSIIHEQKENGAYDLVVAEMDRRKTLGQLSVDTPFIAAYEMVGKELAAAEEAAKPKVPEQPSVVEPKPVLATTVATPKPTTANSDKAKAATPTRTNGAKTPVVDFSKLSDDDFMKSFAGRV